MGIILRSHYFSNQSSLEIAQGDLTLEPLDAIVNAANAHLQHGGGVAGAIVRAGGNTIQQESDRWVKEYGPVGHEKPAYTGSGNLLCKYIIHAVGPVWGEGNEDQKLVSAISGSLKLAESLALSSIAFPAISTGIFGFPKERAAQIMIEIFSAFLGENAPTELKLIRIVLMDPPTLNTFLGAFDDWQSKFLDFPLQI